MRPSTTVEELAHSSLWGCFGLAQISTWLLIQGLGFSLVKGSLLGKKVMLRIQAQTASDILHVPTSLKGHWEGGSLLSLLL